MTFQTAEFPTIRHWWHNTVMSLEPIYDSIKRSSTGLSQVELDERLDKLHIAYATAHRVDMPVEIKAQMIAALSNLMTSLSARYEGQKRVSAKHHRITQVEWILLQDMLRKEGIQCQVIQ